MIIVNMIPVKTPLKHHLSRCQRVAAGVVFCSSRCPVCSVLPYNCSESSNTSRSRLSQRAEAITLPSWKVRLTVACPLFSVYSAPAGNLRRLSTGTASVARLGGIISGVTLAFLSHTRLSSRWVVVHSFILLHEGTSRTAIIHRTHHDLRDTALQARHT